MSIASVVTRGFITSVNELPTRGYDSRAFAAGLADVILSVILLDRIIVNGVLD